MNLNDLTKEPDVKERIDYIFSSFKNDFPDTRYDERGTIVGIGEPEMHLFCYFKLGSNEEILVKFKSENAPITLMDSNPDIAIAIKRTIDLFKTTDFKKCSPSAKKGSTQTKPISKISKKDNSPLDNTPSQTKCKPLISATSLKSNASLNNSMDSKKANATVAKTDRGKNTHLDNKTTKDAELKEMIKNVQPEHETTLLAIIASYRLSNVLSSAGIIYVKDLFRRSYKSINLIPGFGKKMYAELCSILIALSGDDASKELKWDFRVLELSADKKLITNLEKTSEIKSYLYSINNDETRFAEGTAGRILCLRMKAREYSKINLNTTTDIIGAQYFKGFKIF